MTNKTSVLEDISRIFASDKQTVSEVFSRLASMDKVDRDLFICLAALSEEDRELIFNYYKPLWGEEFAKDITKDFVNRGNRKKIEASSNTLKKEASLSSEDSSLVKNYHSKLLGSEYAGDMVENYDNKGKVETKTIEASSYNQLINKYAELLGEDTVEELRNLDKVAASRALQVISKKLKKK